jgi:radical SAM protein with 4Fe4S-binding SPASM domain
VQSVRGQGKRRTVTALPDFIQIEPVGQCNLRCRMCPVQFREDAPEDGTPAFIDYTAFTQLVDQFPQLHRLQIQGLGEPYMHPRFLDMVRYAAARGVEVSVNTNLTLLTARLAAETVQSGLAYLYASIDGATSSTYEAIRLQANFAKVTRNLERLLHARRELGSRTPVVELVYVVMRENLRELPDFVAKAVAWGVDAVNVQHLCHDFGESSLPPRYRPMREFVDAQTLLHEDPLLVRQVFEKARDAASHHGLRLRLPRITGGSARKPGCSWPWKGAYFSYSGETMPCCMISTPDRMSMGNAMREGVASVWNSERFEEFREALSSDQPPEICRSCALYNGTF